MAAGADRIGSDGAAAVVGGEAETALEIGGNVAGSAALGGDGVQLGELAGGGVDGESGDGACAFAVEAADFVGGIEGPAGGGNGEERGIRRLGGKFRGGDRSGGGEIGRASCRETV